MKYYTIFLLAMALNSSVVAQQRFTLSGYVKDASNGEEIIGAIIYEPSSKDGVVSNVYGFYSLTLPEGTYKLQISYIGYTTQVLAIDFSDDREQNILMASDVIEMEEVVISGERPDENVRSIQMSVDKVDMKIVKKLPTLFGEADIIKVVQMQPGVISAGEGTSSFFVRGGGADQNLILIDEAPIYDPSHLFGLFSVFNPDVVKSFELYKGGIPSRFGGRLSSILDVRTKDGNNKKFTGAGGIGLLASRITVEGPLKKDKSSFIVSARRSYVDLFLRLARQKTLVSYYDVNVKFNWKHSNKNRFFAAFYAGRDKLKLEERLAFGWGNMTGTFRWNHLFSNKLFLNTTLVASRFDYGLELLTGFLGFDWTSHVTQFSIKNDLSYFITPKNELNIGYHVSYRSFQPGKIEPSSSSSSFKKVELGDQYGLDHGLYVDNHLSLSGRWDVRYGVRLSVYQAIGKSDIPIYQDPKDNVNINRIGTRSYKSFENIKTFVNVEPRVSIRHDLNGTSSIKASFNRMVQNTHLISAGTTPLPFNTWNPSGYYLDPQIADQVAVGYFKNVVNNRFELSGELFYKEIKNITDFADNANTVFNQDIGTEIRQGNSTAYGLEVSARKRTGNLTGFINYTHSKVTRQVEGVNQGKSFLANYDRRNVVNLAATYDLSDKWSFGMFFTYATGRPITLPAGSYYVQGRVVDYYTGRNGYLLPDFHRLDFSATLNPRDNKNKRVKGQWVFSIYNAYNRKNPFTVYIESNNENDQSGNITGVSKQAKQISLFPIMPQVTYNFKF